MKKVFVFDLDGTLLDSEKKVSPRTIKNLEKLKSLSHEIVFATARPPRFTASISGLFQFKTHLISYNGAQYKTPEKKTISHFINKTLLAAIVRFLTNNDPYSIVSAEENDRWITYKEFDFKTFFNDDIGPERVLKEEFIKNKCAKILINNCSVPDQLIKRFSKDCNIIVTDNGTLIQIMNAEASKENAVKHIIESLKLEMSNVVCFGDDHNDIGLFKISGTSVAMGNAIPELKKIATHMTETNDNDGVSKFIENKFIYQVISN